MPNSNKREPQWAYVVDLSDLFAEWGRGENDVRHIAAIIERRVDRRAELPNPVLEDEAKYFSGQINPLLIKFKSLGDTGHYAGEKPGTTPQERLDTLLKELFDFADCNRRILILTSHPSSNTRRFLVTPQVTIVQDPMPESTPNDDVTERT